MRTEKDQTNCILPIPTRFHVTCLRKLVRTGLYMIQSSNFSTIRLHKVKLLPWDFICTYQLKPKQIKSTKNFERGLNCSSTQRKRNDNVTKSQVINNPVVVLLKKAPNKRETKPNKFLDNNVELAAVPLRVFPQNNGGKALHSNRQRGGGRRSA